MSPSPRFSESDLYEMLVKLSPHFFHVEARALPTFVISSAMFRQGGA